MSGKSERRIRISHKRQTRHFLFALWRKSHGDVLTYRQFCHPEMRMRIDPRWPEAI